MIGYHHHHLMEILQFNNGNDINEDLHHTGDNLPQRLLEKVQGLMDSECDEL